MLNSQRVVAFVSTTSPDRARSFFRDTLGLKLMSEDGFALVFDSNGTMLRVSITRELTPAQFTVLGWDVDDIDVEMDALLKAGVVFERYDFPGQDERGVWTAPGGVKVAWFKDPDANILSLSQHG
jgi:catechol 2,3-dioxygenase-like lactoylglutathione lyase family enzyme